MLNPSTRLEDFISNTNFSQHWRRAHRQHLWTASLDSISRQHLWTTSLDSTSGQHLWTASRRRLERLIFEFLLRVPGLPYPLCSSQAAVLRTSFRTRTSLSIRGVPIDSISVHHHEIWLERLPLEYVALPTPVQFSLHPGHIHHHRTSAKMSQAYWNNLDRSEASRLRAERDDARSEASRMRRQLEDVALQNQQQAYRIGDLEMTNKQLERQVGELERRVEQQKTTIRIQSKEIQNPREKTLLPRTGSGASLYARSGTPAVAPQRGHSRSPTTRRQRAYTPLATTTTAVGLPERPHPLPERPAVIVLPADRPNMRFQTPELPRHTLYQQTTGLPASQTNRQFQRRASLLAPVPIPPIGRQGAMVLADRRRSTADNPPPPSQLSAVIFADRADAWQIEWSGEFHNLFHSVEGWARRYTNTPMPIHELPAKLLSALEKLTDQELVRSLLINGETCYFVVARFINSWVSKELFRPAAFQAFCREFSEEIFNQVDDLMHQIQPGTPNRSRHAVEVSLAAVGQELAGSSRYAAIVDKQVRIKAAEYWEKLGPLLDPRINENEAWADLKHIMKEVLRVRTLMVCTPLVFESTFPEVNDNEYFDHTRMLNRDLSFPGDPVSLQNQDLRVRLGVTPTVVTNDYAGPETLTVHFANVLLMQ